MVNPQAVLAIGAAILFGLAAIEFIKQRRITPGIKARLITAVLFSLVLLWLSAHGQ